MTDLVPTSLASLACVATLASACATLDEAAFVPLDEDAQADGGRRVPPHASAWVPAAALQAADLKLSLIWFDCRGRWAVDDPPEGATCLTFRAAAGGPGRPHLGRFGTIDDQTVLDLRDLNDRSVRQIEFAYVPDLLLGGGGDELTMFDPDGDPIEMALANAHDRLPDLLAFAHEFTPGVAPGALASYATTIGEPIVTSGYRGGRFVESYDLPCRVGFVPDGSPLDAQPTWGATCKAVLDGGAVAGVVGTMEVTAGGHTKRLPIERLGAERYKIGGATFATRPGEAIPPARF
jgi:hypothetical protein